VHVWCKNHVSAKSVAMYCSFRIILYVTLSGLFLMCRGMSEGLKIVTYPLLLLIVPLYVINNPLLTEVCNNKRLVLP
jgi:hypothetical protein